MSQYCCLHTHLAHTVEAEPEDWDDYSLFHTLSFTASLSGTGLLHNSWTLSFAIVCSYFVACKLVTEPANSEYISQVGLIGIVYKYLVCSSNKESSRCGYDVWLKPNRSKTGSGIWCAWIAVHYSSYLVSHIVEVILRFLYSECDMSPCRMKGDIVQAWIFCDYESLSYASWSVYYNRWREIGNLLAACLGDFFSGSYLNMHLNEVGAMCSCMLWHWMQFNVRFTCVVQARQW
jgi:hypothetical protein